MIGLATQIERGSVVIAIGGVVVRVHTADADRQDHGRLPYQQ